MMVYAYSQLYMSTHRWWPESYDRKFTDQERAEPNTVANNSDYDYNPESQLHYYLATMAIDNRYDDEVIDRATNFQTGRYLCLHDQILPTGWIPPRGCLPRHTVKLT